MVAPDSSEVAVVSFDGVCSLRLARGLKMMCVPVPFTVAFVFSDCTADELVWDLGICGLAQWHWLTAGTLICLLSSLISCSMLCISNFSFMRPICASNAVSLISSDDSGCLSVSLSGVCCLFCSARRFVFRECCG